MRSRVLLHLITILSVVGSSGGSPTDTVPFFFSVGEFDEDMMMAAGYPQGFPMAESALDIPFFKVIGGSALKRLGLNTTHTTTTTAAGISFHYTSPATVGTEMYFSIVKGHTHEYPNGTNYPVKMADILWPFSAAHSAAHSKP